MKKLVELYEELTKFYEERCSEMKEEVKEFKTGDRDIIREFSDSGERYGYYIQRMGPVVRSIPFSRVRIMRFDNPSTVRIVMDDFVSFIIPGNELVGWKVVEEYEEDRDAFMIDMGGFIIVLYAEKR